MLNHFLAMKKLMVRTPLSSWAAARWTDLALGVAWVLDHRLGTPAEQADLMELGVELHSQGTDWEAVFHSNFTECVNDKLGDHCRHNVNVAQAIKSSGATARSNGL